MKLDSRILRGQAVLDLYNSGVYAWNQRMAEGKTIQIDFSNLALYNENTQKKVSLESFVFPCKVLFCSTRFGDYGVSFNKSIFEQSVNFSNADFGQGEVDFQNVIVKNGNLDIRSAKFGTGYANFQDIEICKGNIMLDETELHSKSFIFVNAECIGNLSLKETKFHNASRIDFNGMKLSQRLILDKAEFNVVPDFRNLANGRDISMHEMVVKYKTNIEMPKRSMYSEHVEFYRKLKSLAIEANDHAREIEFFAMEEKAKFGWQRNWLRHTPTYLYGLLSDFGRSIVRPFTCLTVTGVIAAFGYQWVNSGALGIPSTQAWYLSFLHLLLFVPGSRGTRINDLCDANKPDKNAITTCTDLMDLIAFGESFFAIFFIFLIGLALRNRFRL